MTIEENNNIVDLASKKKDGVYSKKPYTYAVKNGKMVAYADYSGDVYRCFRGFNSHIGKVQKYEVRATLTKIIKEL
ncbi:hypothetical protein HX021_08225 [Sphingobacterium sp. N143]|uniref:hypothetical protein n=1 Tax=Sphingobacterium sp. N143 TaxID=2746727 RepID=UPI002577556B|nr:hypothetical protein [Sphingobacterium sp. N143]MDM1294283.1 hypothetical protein [Sphingobacterium sp. N143]